MRLLVQKEKAASPVELAYNLGAAVRAAVDGDEVSMLRLIQSPRDYESTRLDPHHALLSALEMPWRRKARRTCVELVLKEMGIEIDESARLRQRIAHPVTMERLLRLLEPSWMMSAVYKLDPAFVQKILGGLYRRVLERRSILSHLQTDFNSLMVYYAFRVIFLVECNMVFRRERGGILRVRFLKPEDLYPLLDSRHGETVVHLVQKRHRQELLNRPNLRMLRETAD